MTRPITTHLLAAAAGWAVYQSLPAAPRSNSPPGPPAVKSAARNDDPAGRAGRLLQNARSPAPATDAKKAAFQQDLAARIDSITVPADIAAALENLALTYEEDEYGHAPKSVEAAALLYHWLDRDPAALFAWIDGREGNTSRMVTKNIPAALKEQLARHGPDPAIAMLPEAAKYDLGGTVTRTLGDELGKNPDLALIARLKEASGDKLWPDLAANLGRYWPLERSADFLKFAVAEDSIHLLFQYRPQDYENRSSRFAAWLADESLPAEFRDKLADSKHVKETLAGDRSLPLAERLAFGGLPDNASNRAELLQRDVDALMGDRDWAFQVHHGHATAEEVLEAIRAAAPGLADAAPDALRDRVFSHLIETDPAAAMSLLDELPPEERHARALEAARGKFEGSDPAKFLDLLQLIPADTPERWQGRLDAWNLRSRSNNAEHGDDYAAWVQALPPGLDREMGLYSLARAVDRRDPDLAAGLRAQIADPTLKEKLPRPR
ncbi:hypothetical protein [Luteolibacter sp. Populi]|uniref:hypothetical protein n=1 Tax=Luteolibacter sp. Populi TaxID=3230487 RepID=UPI0034674A4D